MRPTDDDQAYGTILLGTTRSPGVCTVSGHDRNENWDVQKAKGSTGASSQLNGRDIGTFKVSFYLVDDGMADPGRSQFDRWDQFEKLVRSLTDGTKPVVLPIYHPFLARQGFTEVSNAGVGGMVEDGKGGATVTVTFIEYKPPKAKPAAKAQAKPAQTYANTDEGKRSPPDPNQAAKNELAGLVNEAKKP